MSKKKTNKTKEEKSETNVSSPEVTQNNVPSMDKVMEDFVRNKLVSGIQNPDYKILHSKSHAMLQTEVITHLADGWELVGGISVCTYATAYEASMFFSQAIAKYI